MNKQVEEILEYPVIIERIKRYCAFSGGRELIEQLEPDNSFLAITQQLEYSSAALKCTYAYGSMPFAGIHEIRPAVSYAMRGGIIGIDDLVKIAEHTQGIKGCLKYFKAIPFETEPLDELVTSLVFNDQLGSLIDNCITPEGKIADNASGKLRTIRQKQVSAQRELDSVTKRYLKAHSNDLVDSISATRNERQVVLAKTSYKNNLGGIQYGESASGNAIYLEPEELVPLNNAIASLNQEEAIEIERILRELSLKVKEFGPQLLANMETLSILDALFAKAQFGVKTSGTTASLVKDGNLKIVKGWHPLLDQTKAVRNTYELVSPYKILLISGPNTGGKTVTLKTIGLFTLLTYAGIPVPCEAAQIPLYDQLFVDIGDSQSIEESLSTFSAHMAILGNIFKNADPNSLVLIDELCSGTDPKEGENLAIAVLEHFRQQGIYFIGSTHYGKLKAYALEHPEVLIASMAFDLEKLEPTFKYQPGISGQSNAFEIATRFGFPAEIISRATQLKNDDQSEQDKLIEKLNKQQAENEKLQENLNAEIKETIETKERYQKQQNELTNQKEEYLEKAKQQAEEYLNSKQEEAEDIIDKLKQQKDYNISNVNKLKHELNDLQESEDIPTVSDEQLKVGDYVRILRSNQLGTIEEIKGNKVLIEVNGIKVKTVLSGLRKEAELPKPKQHLDEYPKGVSGFTGELNLIGLTVSEALPLLDKYLDEAIVCHAGFVRIIHGFGTGALKKAVWEKLKHTKGVSKYELADLANGGGGATIVYFKS